MGKIPSFYVAVIIFKTDLFSLLKRFYEKYAHFLRPIGLSLNKYLLRFGILFAISCYTFFGLTVATVPLQATNFFNTASIYAVAIYVLSLVHPKYQGVRARIFLYIASTYVLFYTISIDNGYTDILSVLGNCSTLIGLIVVFIDYLWEECKRTVALRKMPI